MNSGYTIIKSLRESLVKPGLKPTARRILQARLDYWLAKTDNQRRRDTALAGEKSAKVRHIAARRKYRVVQPMVIRMQAEGLIGKEIVVRLKEAGVTNLQGKPYGLRGIQYIMRGV